MSHTTDDEQNHLDDMINEQRQQFHSPYRPPKPRKIDDIVQQDPSDESLQRYKQKLLPALDSVIIDEHDPRCVIPHTIHLIMFVDDTNNNNKTEQTTFSLKNGDLDDTVRKDVFLYEGFPHKFKLDYHVQRDIVTGLQLHVTIKKANALMQHLITDKNVYMIGSHAPGSAMKTYESPIEYAPSGLMARGKYVMKCVICDDYGTEYVKWEWTLKIVTKDEVGHAAK